MPTYRAAGSVAEDLFINLVSDTFGAERLGIIQVNEAIWKHLSNDEKDEIDKTCDVKLEAYFGHVANC